MWSIVPDVKILKVSGFRGLLSANDKYRILLIGSNISSSSFLDLIQAVYKKRRW